MFGFKGLRAIPALGSLGLFVCLFVGWLVVCIRVVGCICLLVVCLFVWFVALAKQGATAHVKIIVVPVQWAAQTGKI